MDWTVGQAAGMSHLASTIWMLSSSLPPGGQSYRCYKLVFISDTVNLLHRIEPH